MTMTSLHKRLFGALAAFGLGLGLSAGAWAAGEMLPSGDPVINQARQARLLTKSDATVLVPTRAIYIGDAAACSVALVLVGDSAAVTFANVQPGGTYPFQITKLMSTNTTCTAVISLY